MNTRLLATALFVAGFTTACTPEQQASYDTLVGLDDRTPAAPLLMAAIEAPPDPEPPPPPEPTIVGYGAMGEPIWRDLPGCVNERWVRICE